MSVDRETIYERFGFAVEEDLQKLVELAKKESADDDEALLTAVCVIEEVEGSTRSLRQRIEDERGRIGREFAAKEEIPW